MTAYATLALAIQGYEVPIFRFVPKDQVEAELPSILQKAYATYLEHDFLTLKVKNTLYRIQYANIYAIYSQAHYVEFLLAEETLHVRGSLREYVEKLPANHFCQIKKNIYVNLHQIRTIQEDKVILGNQRYFFISPTYRKSLIQRFMEVI